MESALNPIDILLDNPNFKANFSKIEKIPKKEAVFAEFPSEMNECLRETMKKHGFLKLYSHQRECWDFVQEGKNVVIVTPTSSGKTLCYNLPVINAMLNDENARALYLFPTKALSQDQQAELGSIIEDGKLPISVSTYDGDTSTSIRKMAREKSSIVITNPDMLHSGVLPNHTKWIKFFAGLKYIVIDEMHTYRGVFGSHVANVIKRMIRIAEYYGSKPTFILCSATIGNPGELAKALINKDVVAITKNGAPRAEKTVAFYNPRLIDYAQGLRQGASDVSMELTVSLLEKGIRTILFARSRSNVEILSSYINNEFKNINNNNYGIKVAPYRSGLLPLERRAIEKGLRDGQLTGVVSTNALELGIDIGGLDAVVLAGWPGSLASFWQQSGRAGRRTTSSVAIYVANSSPLDQYFVNHPEKIFSESSEQGKIDPYNPYIYMDHIKCASFELPFTDEEASKENVADALSFLEEDGIVRHSGNKWHWASTSYPSERISLRSATSENVIIINTTRGQNEVLGEMDRSSAKELIFDNAIYIHLGRQFFVTKLDIENLQCFVIESNVNYYTDGIVKTDIKVLTEDEHIENDKFNIVIGDLLVRSNAEKYKKLKFNTDENIGYGEISMPPEELQTRTMTIVFSDETEAGKYLQNFKEMHRAAILSSYCNIIRELAPASILCERSDIGVSWRIRDDHYSCPTIYFWDKYPGGTGLCEALSKVFKTVLTNAIERINLCSCEDGCPSCIGVQSDSVIATKDRKSKCKELLLLCNN